MALIGRQSESDSDPDNTEISIRQTRSRTASTSGRRTATSKKGRKSKKTLPASKIASKPQRCTLHAFWSFVDTHREYIPEETWDILSGTPFGPMLNTFRDGLVSGADLIKKEVDLEIIMKHYDNEAEAWVFGEEIVNISSVQIQYLFGFPDTERDTFQPVLGEEDKTIEATQMFNDCFAVTGPTRADILKRLEMLTILSPPKKKKKPRHLASLMLMYLLACFFFSRTGINLTWDLVKLCLNLQDLDRWDWAQSVLVFLKNGLKKYDKNKPSHLNGCVLLVQYWFLESTRHRAPRRDPALDGRPSFCRWSINNMFGLIQLQNRPSLLEELIIGGPWIPRTNASDFPGLVTSSSEDNTPKTGPDFVLNLDNLTRQLQDIVESVAKLATTKNAAAAGKDVRRHGEIIAQLKDVVVRQLGEKKRHPEENVDSEYEEEVDDDEVVDLNDDDDNGDDDDEEGSGNDNDDDDDEGLHRRDWDLNGGGQPFDEQNEDVEVEVEKVNEPEKAADVETAQKSSELFGRVVVKIGTDKVEVEADKKVDGEETPADAPVQAPAELTLSLWRDPNLTDSADPNMHSSIPDFEIDTQGLQQIDEVVRSIVGDAPKVVQPERVFAHGRVLPPLYSIERNVKLNPRDLEKKRSSEFMYTTPEEARTIKKAKKGAATNVAGGVILNVKGIDTDRDSWQSLPLEVQRDYADYLNGSDELYLGDFALPYQPLVDKAAVIGALRGNDLDANMIRLYIDIMTGEMTESQRGQFCIIPPEASYYVLLHRNILQNNERETSGHEIEIATLLTDKLWAEFYKTNILVPIHHHDSNHYTLLRVNHSTKRITHLNSLRPKKGADPKSDRYQQSARVVADEIRNFVEHVQDTHLFKDVHSQDYERERERDWSYDHGSVLTKNVPLSDDDKKTRDFIVSKQLVAGSYTFHEDLKCPQQKSLSSDCGAFMLHFMDCIINRKSSTQRDGTRMRTTIMCKLSEIRKRSSSKQ